MPSILPRARAVAAVAALLALGASATAEARTVTVYSGPPPRVSLPKDLELSAFLPRRVKVHVGDTVRWRFDNFDTVTFEPAGQSLPPYFVPDPANPVTGYADATGNPFFWNGQTPLSVPTAILLGDGGTTTDGSAIRHSGLPLDGSRVTAPYSLTFTRPGVYRYRSAVHLHRGVIEVVPAAAPAPSQSAVSRQARREARALIVKAERLARLRPGSRRVAAGHDTTEVGWLRFFPRTLKIRRGESVDFFQGSPTRLHNIAFGPEEYRDRYERTILEIKPPAAAGGFPRVIANPVAFLPSDPLPLPGYDGRNHGNGFLNTGMLPQHPPKPVAVRFTRRGTFAFECLVHPGMIGRIKVR